MVGPPSDKRHCQRGTVTSDDGMTVILIELLVASPFVLKGVLVGSVAQRVVRQAPCSVWVVR